MKKTTLLPASARIHATVTAALTLSLLALCATAPAQKQPTSNKSKVPRYTFADTLEEQQEQLKVVLNAFAINKQPIEVTLAGISENGL